MKIILIRHAESLSNEKDELAGGVIDKGLSELGRKQAKQLANKLKDEEIEAIYSSDMKRTMETAQEIAKSHNLKIIQDKRLREFNPGEGIGWGFDKLIKYQEEMAIKQNISKRDVQYPGGESERDHFNRVEEFLNEVIKKHPGTIVVVAHSGTNKNLFGIIGHVPIEKIYSVGQGNACVNEIEYSSGNFQVNRLSCIKHLDSDKKLIKLFDNIRDEPLDVIKNRCWEKHKKLKKVIEGLGYKVRFEICSFKWSKQRFPPEILKLCKKDLDYHAYLKVRIHGKWIDVDASNDNQLPEYNQWDGLTDCKLCVNPEEIFMFKESDELLNKLGENEGIIKVNKDFLEAVNRFLDKIRKK